MYRIYLAVLLALLTAGAVGSRVHAGLFPQSLRFEIAGSYGSVSPDGINDFLRNHNAYVGEERFHMIERFGGVDFTIRQSISPRIVLLFGAGYLRGSTNEAKAILYDDYGYLMGATAEQYRLSSFPMAAGVGYYWQGNNTLIGAEIAGELHFVAFEQHFEKNSSAGIPEYSREWSGEALGGNVAVSACWNLLAKIYFGMRSGYRFTGDAELTLEEDESFFDPIVMDFSGFYISLLVGVTPWK